MTNFVQMTAGQASKYVTFNEALGAVSPAGLFGKKHTTTTGLTFGYYGGQMIVDGALSTHIADGTVALTASSTNYVEATRAGSVVTNTTGFTAGRIPLWEIVTGTSSISSYTDRRLPAGISPWVGNFLSRAFASDANTALTAAEARARLTRTAGTSATTRNVVVPLNGMWTVHNATGGSPSSSIQIIGSTGTGITIGPGMVATVYGDGTNICRASADTTG